ncbi:MAG: hypothetical protein WC459_04085 [Patescibacteria group bacterium]
MDKIKEILKIISAFIGVIIIVPMVIGFFIWNIYLAKLGFWENDLIKTRFIITGILFSGLFLMVLFGIFKILPSVKNWILENFHKPFVILLIVIILLVGIDYYVRNWFVYFPLSLGGGEPRAISFLMETEEQLERLNKANLGVIKVAGSTLETNKLCLLYENKDDIIIAVPKLININNEPVKDISRIISFRKNSYLGLSYVPVEDDKKLCSYFLGNTIGDMSIFSSIKNVIYLKLLSLLSAID